MHLSGGKEREKRPGCLRRSTGTAPHQRAVIIGLTNLSPPAIQILFGLKPVNRLSAVMLGHIFTDSLQPAKHGPGTINIVYSPASPPGAFRLLFRLEKIQRPDYCRMIFGIIECTQEFEHT